MKAYNSKVVTIHAVQFLGDASIHEAIKHGKVFEDKTNAARAGKNATHFYLEGQHGDEGIWPTDWLMQGMEGEFYPCKDSVFRRKYEAAE